MHAERVLEDKIAGFVSFTALHGVLADTLFALSLRMALSEQNLELLPDYEQRIEVLKDLRFIDDNQTVLLKGRVACEVSSRLVRSHALQADRSFPLRSIPPTSSSSLS